MQAPESGAVALLKKLRGSSKPSSETGEKKCVCLRRLPKILKYIPGKPKIYELGFGNAVLVRRYRRKH